MRYQLKVYDGGDLDDPVRVGQCEDARDMLDAVQRELDEMYHEEGTRFSFGAAGDDELFEVYPDNGLGTVVVETL